VKDITELSVTTVTDFKDLQNVLRNYKKDVDHPKVTGAMIIKVTAASQFASYIGNSLKPSVFPYSNG
jgi:hypothetical protein